MHAYKKKRTVCIIPARYGSIRLPGKPLIPVKGLPLIMWTYAGVIESGAFDDVYVATDDSRILSAVEQHGGKAVITSPDHTSGTDRVHEAARDIAGDYIVNVQGDEPQIPADLLKEFTESLHLLDNFSLLTCVTYATIEDMHNANVVKAVLNSRNEALYFSRAPIPYGRDAPYRGYKHIGIYGFTRESLAQFCSLEQGILEQVEKLEQLRALEHGMKIHCIIKEYTGIGIDTEEDLASFRSAVEKP
jgi:3-deoxy-manno-octulosonate cytidylyltransferase (CMP-KDO synthetase)